MAGRGAAWCGEARFFDSLLPGFDSLKLKEEIQVRILRETTGMTDEEVRNYFREKSECFDAKINRRRSEKQR
jgi:hypothetical protein